MALDLKYSAFHVLSPGAKSLRGNLHTERVKSDF